VTAEEFLSRLPAIRAAAREVGYAIGTHGSMARDFDLIAVPWTAEAADADTVAQTIFKAAGGLAWTAWPREAKKKPHGRRCYCFRFVKPPGHGAADAEHEAWSNLPYVDLSVTPRTEESTR
jgi:hypothetical protein